MPSPLIDILAIAVISLAIYLSTLAIKRDNFFLNLLGLIAIGVACSSLSGGIMGMVFGFTPVLVNSLVISFILYVKRKESLQ